MLRPRDLSVMLPLSPYLKDAFEKQDLQASNLSEGKFINPPTSTSKWYNVGQPCFKDRMQELNPDFAKICISPKPSGAAIGQGSPMSTQKTSKSIRQGKTSALLTLQLLSLRLLLFVTPPWKSVRTVSSLLS